MIVARLVEDLEELGHNEVILKDDGEPALVQLLREVKSKRIANTIVEHPPAYDPQSNGPAENAVQDVMVQVRARRICFEQNIE